MHLSRTTLVLVAAILGTPAYAQDLPTTETIRLDLSPYLQPGTPIRISGTALHRVGGYVVGLQTDAILVGNERGAPSNGARPIQLAAVDTLWTRGNWIWPGLALGSSAGGFVGGAICVFSGNEKCRAFPIALIGGIAAGAAVGFSRKVWHSRYVRRDGGPVPTIGSWSPR